MNNIQTIEEIKKQAEELEYTDKEIFDKAREILKETFLPEGANAQRGSLKAYNAFFEGLEIAGVDTTKLEELSFDYFAIFDEGFREMITHSQTQKRVWWLKNLLDEEKDYIEKKFNTEIC